VREISNKIEPLFLGPLYGFKGCMTAERAALSSITRISRARNRR